MPNSPRRDDGLVAPISGSKPGRGFTWKSGAPGIWVHANHTIESVRADRERLFRFVTKGCSHACWAI